jgi:diguanylate cyclase (GGDEF)-like protein
MGANVSPSAHSQFAGDRNGPRWDRARAGRVTPVGAIVGVAVALAILAVAGAALIAAQRADAVSLDNQRQLVRQAIAADAERILRQVESAIATPRAAHAIGDNDDPQWLEVNVGQWLENFFGDDVVLAVDGGDRVKYTRTRSAIDLQSVDLHAELAPSLDILRRRPGAMPSYNVAGLAAADAAQPGRGTALLQRFLDRPAIVAAAMAGAEADLSGNIRTPIVLAVKYLDDGLLQSIGERLGLRQLRQSDRPAPAGDATAELVDAKGDTIARLAWKPDRPGAAILSGVLPFVAAAFLGFALLAAMVFRYMRRTAAAIATGERQLRHLALHDPVSGLPNRIYFAERLEQAIAEVRGGGLSAAVFYIDLDHFKDVNDTLGHHIGDALILNVTQRLSHIMRGDDLVARLGGDEFGIITTCASDSYSLQAIAGRIIAALCAPYAINGHNIIIGASIGIAVIDRRTDDAGDVQRYADMALYRAKNEGRNRACIYDTAMDADLSSRKLLEGDLLQAIKNDGLRAAYQPIVNASGDTIIGVEALARWTHPTHGEIPPSRFIPIAEHSGLIVELGEWMLRRACLDGRDWPGLTVAVNVSPLQFRRSDFVELVERILTETDFDANRLELELTESTLLGNFETAELSMLRLKAIGVRFALDDFGTGYSSLLYLRRFPFDKLKIDSSFVRSIEKAPDAAAIVHAVVSLGRGLGMKVTAEGVETAEQHLFLRAAGVHSMQGYRFGKPGVASAISVRLDSPEDYRFGNPDQEIALAS